jgi:hypothetical protein
MRRAVPSFTVEVRRRPRLPIISNPGAQPSQSNPPQAAFDRASHGAAATAFGAKKMDPSPVDVATSRPTGRILPSLFPDEPWHRLLDNAPVSAADSEPPLRASKRPAVRAAKQGEQASKSPQSSTFSSDENVPLAERLSTKSHRTSGTESGEGAGATPEDRMRAPSPIVGDASSLVLTAEGRKRTIMARYVFANEDKPGERWKRRVLRSR